MKPRECEAPGCVKTFIPMRLGQRACGPYCGMKIARAIRKKKEEAEKESLKARKAALKRIPDLIKEADKVFAAYIRARDKLAGYPCISSGRPLDWSGNKVDSGHYRSRGAASHLRYHPDNCHAQTKTDNQWKAGNIVSYRAGLIERIGIDRVVALESNNDTEKWTREKLLAIKDEFKAKFAELKEQADESW